MSLRKYGVIGITAVAVLTAGCGAVQTGDGGQPPAVVQHVAGLQNPRIVLSGEAVSRLGIKTGPVRVAAVTVAGRRARHKVIPYSAVIYASDGTSWAYVRTAARVFAREPITILVIQGPAAVLAKGPAAGTQVVTVGGAELLGAEYNISGEE